MLADLGLALKTPMIHSYLGLMETGSSTFSEFIHLLDEPFNSFPLRLRMSGYSFNITGLIQYSYLVRLFRHVLPLIDIPL